jgi:capsular exopolysaccharide synthesis family protein
VESPLNNQQEETIDFRKYIYLIITNWYWFAMSIIFCLVIAFIVNRYSQMMYSVDSTIIVRDDDNTKSMGGQESFLQSLKLLQQTKSVQNEIGILQTYRLARWAINELPEFHYTYVKVGRTGFKEDQLYTNCPFQVEEDTLAPLPFNAKVHITLLSPSTYKLETKLGKKDFKHEYTFGQPVILDSSKFTIKWRRPEAYTDKMQGFHYFFTVNDPHDLANLYRGKLAVALNDKKGSILTLSIKGSVASQEADYLNKLMDVYIRYGLASKNAIAENTIKFIDSQIGGISDSLKRTEISMQNFRTKNMVIDISEEGKALYQQLEDLQVNRNLAEIRGKYLDYLTNYVEQKKEIKDIIMPSVIGITDGSLSKAINDVNDLYVEKKVMGYSVQPNNPAMDMLNLKIENTRKVLLQTIKSLSETNKLAMKDADEHIREAEAKVSKLPTNERELISIKRDFDVLDKMYTYLLEKRAEAGIAKASNISDSRILDVALDRNAQIVKPKKKMNYLIGFFVGFLIPFSVLIGISLLNNTIQSRKELESATQIPVYGGIGHNYKETDIPVYDNPKSSLSESFRGLRTNLQYAGLGKEGKIVLVSSTVSSEGKTFVAINLASIFSIVNKKTLLLGLDLRKPKLDKIFNIGGNNGISTYLAGQCNYEDTIRKTSIPNLYVASSGPVPPNPAELLETDKMKEFLEKASAEYDFIIIDTPPVAIVTDALLLAPLADICLYVVRQNYSSREVVSLIESIYQRKDVKHLGIVLNDVQNQGYYGNAYHLGYNYGYSYNNGYGTGYYIDDEAPKRSLLEKIRNRMGIRSKV